MLRTDRLPQIFLGPGGGVGRPGAVAADDAELQRDFEGGPSPLPHHVGAHQVGDHYRLGHALLTTGAFELLFQLRIESDGEGHFASTSRCNTHITKKFHGRQVQPASRVERRLDARDHGRKRRAAAVSGVTRGEFARLAGVLPLLAPGDWNEFTAIAATRPRARRAAGTLPAMSTWGPASARLGGREGNPRRRSWPAG